MTSSDSEPDVQDLAGNEFASDDDESIGGQAVGEGDLQEEEEKNDDALRLGESHESCPPSGHHFGSVPELSQTPFEELLKLRDKLGTKAYDETIVRKLDKSVAKNKNNKNQVFKRANKNRPQEMSSKKPVGGVREVFAVKKKTEEQLRRDPRFEEQSGHFSQNVFDKTYAFLKEKKLKELNDLKKMLKRTKDEDKRKELSYLLQRMNNQMMAEEIKQKKKQIETNVRKDLSQELGTKKTFVNKCKHFCRLPSLLSLIFHSLSATLKRLELVDRFKQLKKSGKLKKYLEKKRKRNAMRERKKIPNNQRERDD